MVVIFFLQHRMGGGTTTFTAHLAEGFRRIGEKVKIVRINYMRDGTIKPFGDYGFDIVSFNDVEALSLAKHNPSILTAPTYPRRLPKGYMDRGYRLLAKHDSAKIAKQYLELL